MSTKKIILITGAAGNIGSIGPKVIKTLHSKGYSVRAMVRKIDSRSAELEKIGDIDIVVGDLTNLEDVKRVVNGCSRVYFSMSPSSNYIEATTMMATVLKEYSQVELFVNMSQMTVSSMNIYKLTDSKQQINHWLSEKILNWSGLPVVHIRPTVFLEHPFFSIWAFESIKKDLTIKLPFGQQSKISPIATDDISNVISTILMTNDINLTDHIGKIYELTGPKSETMNEITKEYSDGLELNINYIDIPFEEWYNEKKGSGFIDDHLLNHFSTMTKLIKDNKYDRHTDDVELITGKKATSIYDWASKRKSNLRLISKPSN